MATLGPPAEWFPLSRGLVSDDLNGFRVAFSPALSGEYAITLKFRYPIEAEDVRTLVDRAAASVGIDGTVISFDFDWRVLDGDRAVANGTGQRGATGTIDTGSAGLGGGTPNSRALAFGSFRAEAHHTYTLDFTAGPQLASVIRVAPVLEVMLNPISLHPDWPR